jgi:lipoate---protein ligase
MKCQEKISGGKLACLELWEEGGRVSRAKLTGDFFLYPEERISEIERSLVGLPLDATQSEIALRVVEGIGDGTLIGLSPEDIGRMFRKAVA